MDNGVKWAFAFGKGDASKFGLMMRRNQAPLTSGSDDILSDDKLYHQTFHLSCGENVQFPRPFVISGGEKGKSSGIFAKTKGEVFSYSNNPCLSLTARGDIYYMSEGEVCQQKKEDLQCKKIELSAMIGIMCPMLTNYSSTIHYEQGATRTGKCMLDLSVAKSLDGGWKSTKFNIDDILRLLLVGITRANKSENISLAAVDSIINAIAVQGKERNFRVRLKRELTSFLTRYERFR